MDSAWFNDIAKRPRITPTNVLQPLRPLRFLDPKDKRRAIKSKREREIVDACLFCFGLSCRMQRLVWVVDADDADYDFVAVWKTNNGDDYFLPVQLKEVVPKRLNPNDSIQSIIDRLAKYGPDLSVAIRVNRQGMLDLDEITLPSSLKIAALWVYGAVSQDGSRWWITGNLMEPGPNESWIFNYPA
jgi:hypothetical protein